MCSKGQYKGVQNTSEKLYTLSCWYLSRVKHVIWIAHLLNPGIMFNFENGEGVDCCQWFIMINIAEVLNLV